MMLRASIEHSGARATVTGISEGSKVGDAGIAHGEKLLTFVDAAVRGDAMALATARDDLRVAMGSAALVDTAAVIGNFERMVRIADGTGIPLDGFIETLAGDLPTELRLDEFSTRRVESSGLAKRAIGPLVRRVTNAALRLAGRRSRRRR